MSSIAAFSAAHFHVSLSASNPGAITSLLAGLDVVLQDLSFYGCSGSAMTKILLRETPNKQL